MRMGDGGGSYYRARLEILYIHHELFLLLLDGQLYKTPLKKPANTVLDFGTVRCHNESRYVVEFRTLALTARNM